MSVGRASPAVAATNSLLYVIGGDQTSEVNDFYRAQVRRFIDLLFFLLNESFIFYLFMSQILSDADDFLYFPFYFFILTIYV